MESAGKTDERKAYCINTDNFTAALAELIRVYQSETPGMEYRCKCHEQARADDANAKNLIALYTMFQKRPEPAAWALLEGAVDDWRKANP